MRSITPDDGEAEVFARAALGLKYDDLDKPAPITASQILMPHRSDDRRPDLWSVFNRTQENLTKGGLSGRNANGHCQRTRFTRNVRKNPRRNGKCLPAGGRWPEHQGHRADFSVTPLVVQRRLKLANVSPHLLAQSWGIPRKTEGHLRGIFVFFVP
jgi:hypothetical protein